MSLYLLNKKNKQIKLDNDLFRDVYYEAGSYEDGLNEDDSYKEPGKIRNKRSFCQQ